MRTTLLLFLFTISAWSQTGNLTGKVTFGTNELAYGSSVIIKGTQKYAIVNDFTPEETALLEGKKQQAADTNP